MSQSDDRPQQPPWTDPQTHLDTDPVNAAPAPVRGTADQARDDDGGTTPSEAEDAS
jgi:hypothetical protein